MSRYQALSESTFEYMLKTTSREPELMRRLREETSGLPEARMQIGPDQGQFLAFLVQTLQAKNCLEIGVFTGYSALCVALALPAEGKLVACDISAEWTSIGRRHWNEAGVDSKIDLRLGHALKTLDRLLASGCAGTFDFAFIDADKTNYSNYYERCLKLLRLGGVIAIDNTLWSGKVADDSIQDADTVAIRELTRKLQADRRVDFCMLTVGDGVALARKRAGS